MQLFSSPWRQFVAKAASFTSRQRFRFFHLSCFPAYRNFPMIAYFRRELEGDANAMIAGTLTTNEPFDKLGLLTVEAYRKSREQVVLRRQQDLPALSARVVGLWKDVPALPLTGTPGSARTQVVMESVLQKTSSPARV
jgi:rsbT co-antagonist protein RsbR